MKPYYQDNLVTIYNGNCEDGIKEADTIIWDAPHFEEKCIDYKFKTMFIFCGFQNLLEYMLVWYPQETIPLLWHRRIVAKGNRLLSPTARNTLCNDYILIVGEHHFPYLPIFGVPPPSEKVHPWERPVALLYALLGITKGDILDPFLGSGSTAVAAKKLGRKCVGYEIEEKYCEIAANRCREIIAQPNPYELLK